MLDAKTNSLIEKMATRLEVVDRHTDAIKQLESSVLGLPAAIAGMERKLHAVRATSWDRRGNYRGIFDDESEARAFGLLMMSKAMGLDASTDDLARRAADALKGEFKDIHAKAMDSTTDGALIPPQFSNRLQRLVEQFGTFEANSFIIPMMGESLSFMRRTGGVSVFVIGENAAGTASQPTYGTVNLTSKELGTLTYVPRTLADDMAAAIGELIAIEVAQGFAEACDDDGFNGAGAPAYHGFVGVRTRLATLNGVDEGGGLVLGSGNAYSEITLADCDRVMGTIPTYAAPNAKWYCSRMFFFTVLARLANAAGGVTAAEIEGRRQLMFGGDPVVICQKLPTTAANSQICALYGDLLFLNQKFNPADIAAVDEAANLTGQGRATVGAARAQFISQTSGMSDDKREALWRELTQTSLTTSAPMTAQVELFTKTAQFIDDPNRAQNIIRKTQELSPEASPQALATLLPRVLPFADVESMKLTPEDIAGLTVSAMKVAGSPDQGVTSLRNILLNLGGSATPEGKAILDALGAPSGDGIMKQLGALSTGVKGGQLDIEKMGTLVGKENTQVLLSMLQQLPMVQSNVSQIGEVGKSNRDTTEEAIVNIFGGSEQQRLRLQTEQAKARIEGIKSKDTNAQRVVLARTLYEEELIKRGYSPWGRNIALAKYDMGIGMGKSPKDAVAWSDGPFSDMDTAVANELDAGPEVGGGKRVFGPMDRSGQMIRPEDLPPGVTDPEQLYLLPGDNRPLDFTPSYIDRAALDRAMRNKSSTPGSPAINGATQQFITIFNNSPINGKDARHQDSGVTEQE